MPQSSVCNRIPPWQITFNKSLPLKADSIGSSEVPTQELPPETDRAASIQELLPEADRVASPKELPPKASTQELPPEPDMVVCTQELPLLAEWEA